MVRVTVRIDDVRTMSVLTNNCEVLTQEIFAAIKKLSLQGVEIVIRAKTREEEE